ncbi:MAG: hypothetical protein AAB250_18550 [Bdellovibrionota bacterium]
MMRKQPVILLLVFGILAAYALHDYSLTMNSLRGEFNENILAREERMGRFLDDLTVPAKNGHFDVIHKRAEMLRQADILDFYILHDDGAVLWWAGTDVPLEAIDKPYDRFNEPVFAPDFTRESLLFDNGMVLTIGIEKSFDKFFEKQKDFVRGFIIHDVIMVSMIVIFVALWSLKDIRALFEKMQKGDLKGLATMDARSQESELFMRGFSGFAQSVDDLQHANDLLNKQILPSLKKEIFSGKKPPYDFNCTLVRVDINNFSTIYNSHDVTSFMQVINEFFVEVSHVVTRYGGLIHEFVGDEVIIYFKDEDHAHSFLIAISAIRDVNSVAEQFNLRTVRDYGYPFTVKSSLAHGRVRFGPLVNGYTVAGSVLIETVRILANIQEKDGNVVFFDRSNSERLRSVVNWREAQTVKLKGFNGDRVLCSYEGHRPLQDLLSSLTLENVIEIDFYRADDHLVAILGWLRRNADEMSEKVLHDALMHLRGAHLTKTNENFGDFLLSWCEQLTQPTGRRGDIRRMTTASAVVKLMIPLVPRDKFTTTSAERLKLLLDAKDRRVVANVLEVLTHFQVAEDKKILEALESDDDARISANALVHSARDEITRSVVKGLNRMLNSRTEETIASALFAVGEIASHHRKRDYVYFSTQIALKELLVALPHHLSSPYAMVRRQAVVAAVKIGEAEIIAEFEKRISASSSLTRELKDLLPPKENAA